MIRPDEQVCSYDKTGNPVSDGTWAYTWERGRQLASMSDGTTTWNYTYDKDGLRLSRTDGALTYNYVYLGGQLVQMTVADATAGTTTTMKFNYDASGVPVSFMHNGTTYYYITNLQGDVVGIINQSGAQIVSYAYDAWGNPLETTVNESVTNAAAIAANNPLRYRGYVYDTEAGLYYLQSRYYNPEMGRFLNADALVSTGGLLGNNMFAYCGNNPIAYLDVNGEKATPVGAGVQIEVNIGGTCVGLEVIVYWDVEESNNGAPVIAVYIYGGLSLDINDPYVASIIGVITDNADLLIGEDGSGARVMAMASLLSDSFNIGVSGLVIFGNEYFNSTRDYEESFTSVGGTWGKAKGSVAYSETCTAISIGGNIIGKSNLLPSWGVSKTYYQQIFCYSVKNEK